MSGNTLSKNEMLFIVNFLLLFFRYKIVCIVGIVEKKSQGMLSKVKFLRDVSRDKYVKTKFENNNLVATIVVGAFYHE